MKRHKALRSLSQEHHHGLMLAQLIKTGSPKYKGLPHELDGKKLYTIKFFEKNLIPHFRKEEQVLFPLLRSKSENIAIIVDELINQHKKVRLLIERLKKTVEPEKVLDELGRLLEIHIRKEERELFQMIQEVLSEEELLKLETNMGVASPAVKFNSQ